MAAAVKVWLKMIYGYFAGKWPLVMLIRACKNNKKQGKTEKINNKIIKQKKNKACIDIKSVETHNELN